MAVEYVQDEQGNWYEVNTDPYQAYPYDPNAPTVDWGGDPNAVIDPNAPVYHTNSTDTPVDDNGNPYPGSDPTNPQNDPPPSGGTTTTPITTTTTSGPQGTTTFTQQHTDPTAAGYSPYSDPNWADVEAQLKAYAEANGLVYDQNDLADVQRKYYNTGATGGQGGDLQAAINMAYAKYDSRTLYDGISVGDRSAANGTGAPGSTSTSWFTQNAPGSGTSTTAFPSSIYPAPFGETYNAPARPDYLTGAYTPSTWSENYTPLTLEELQQVPGYFTRLDAGQRAFERSAAAKGSILSGGSQQALNRYAQDYAANEYAAEDSRRFRNYQQRYGQFVDYNNLAQQARAFNEAAYQNDVGNYNTGYRTRYQTYLDAITNNRNAENDYWSRNQDLVQNSLQAAALARP